MTDSNLMGFGIVLTIGCISLVLSGFSEDSDRGSSPPETIELQQQCQRLREELVSQQSQLKSDFNNATFEQLQTLLTNYPTACKMAQTTPDLPAKNLVALFTPLENLLQAWGIEAIGSPWQSVSYDPHLHQPDEDDIAIGEQVYIRFVGYRTIQETASPQILCPAKVSRTLPAAAHSSHDS